MTFFKATLVPADGGRPSSNMQPYRIDLQARSSAAGGFVEVEPLGADAPVESATVWLQVWELDAWEAGIRGAPRGEDDQAAQDSGGGEGEGEGSGEEDEEVPPNDKLAVFGGAIRLVRGGRRPSYEFVVTEYTPREAPAQPLGSVLLRLRRAEGGQVGEEPETIEVHVQGEAERRLEIGVCLVPSADTGEVAGETLTERWPRELPLVHMRNTMHALRSQIADGGLCVGFHVDYNDAPALAARAWYRSHTSPSRPYPGTRQPQKDWDLADCIANATACNLTVEAPPSPMSERALYDISNDMEFTRVGPDFAERCSAFMADANGRLTVGSHVIHSPDPIAPALQAVRTAAQQALGEGEAPLVRRIAIFCHGFSTGLNMHEGALRARDAERVVAQWAPHLAPNVVIALYACSAGRSDFVPRGTDSTSDPTYGREPAEGQVRGSGSMGFALRDALVAAGKTECTVWAHTTVGHTTDNSFLRCFAGAAGSSAHDLVNLGGLDWRTLRRVPRASGLVRKAALCNYSEGPVAVPEGQTPPPGGPFDLHGVIDEMKERAGGGSGGS